MSVLIKGMDIPKGCGCCPLCDDECFGAYKCYRASAWGDEFSRASDCPLVEIPTPHGRLIDADDLDCVIRRISPIRKGAVGEAIFNAPTIIEAEEYRCSKCKKPIEDESDSLIIDTISESGNTEEYFGLCHECLKTLGAEVSEK